MAPRGGVRVVRVYSSLVVAALVVGACHGGSDEGTPQLAVRSPPGASPVTIALSDFRPLMPLGAHGGGRCREDAHVTHEGLLGVVWRREDGRDSFWEIRVALDSANAVRRYFEDRYGGSSGRTMIRVEMAAGRGTAGNSIPGGPAETATGDAVTVFHALNLDDPSAQAARVLQDCRASLDPWGLLARLPDSLRPPPVPRPAPRTPTFDRAYGRREWTAGVLGVRQHDFEGFRWLRMVVLPLYAEPGGEPAGWLARGWVVRPLAPAAVWEAFAVAGGGGTGGEDAGLTILHARDDGWFRLRYAAPDSTSDGTAWAHTSQLQMGDVDLEIVRWEEHFLRGEERVLRASGVHYLREAPSDEGIVLDSLKSHDRWRERSEDSHALAPVEVRGDWMRVRVQRPGGWCGDPPGPRRTTEGWVRWRDSVNGLLLATGSPTC